MKNKTKITLMLIFGGVGSGMACALIFDSYWVGMIATIILSILITSLLHFWFFPGMGWYNLEE